jgi:hypothetical protein
MGYPKLEFVRDGFGAVQRFVINVQKGKYRSIYLAPEVTKKVEGSRTEARIEDAGLYYLRRGDIVLR